MYDQMNLSAAQRGYKQPGKKLRPRDAHDAMERDHLRLHSMRALRRTRMAEAAAYGPEYGTVAAHVKKLDRAMANLNERDRKWVYRLLDSNGAMPAMPGNVRRAYMAAIECDQIERCIEWDRKTLANAY